MTTTNTKDLISNTQQAKTPAKAKNYSVKQYVQAYKNEIAKALPSVMTPERFTRIALSAISNNPKLAECNPTSFIGAMMQAAQLGLEPNTSLGQAYLIPYGNDVQFQLGYKGLIDLAYRSGEVKTIIAQIVYENDEFDFEYGLNPKLYHKPAKSNRGKAEWVYAVFKLVNGGEGFEVMSIEDVIKHGKKYSKSFNRGPWQDNPEEMYKKTLIKRVLKYAPLKSDFVKAVQSDDQVVKFEKPEEEDTAIPADYLVVETEDIDEGENK